MMRMNDIVSFINKAMDRGLKFDLLEWSNDTNPITQTITITKDVNNKISFILDFLKKDLHIQGNSLGYFIKDLSEYDMLSFRTAYLRAYSYLERYTESYFNGFFKEEIRPTNIDDLDDGDNS